MRYGALGVTLVALVVLFAVIFLPLYTVRGGGLEELGPGEDRRDDPAAAVLVLMAVMGIFLTVYVLHNPISVDGEEDEADGDVGEVEGY